MLLVVFLALIIGPIVAGSFLKFDLKGLPFDIMQPSGYSNNDTSSTPTGSCIHGACPEYQGGGGGDGGGDAEATDSAESTDDAARRLFRRYMAY